MQINNIWADMKFIDRVVGFLNFSFTIKNMTVIPSSMLGLVSKLHSLWFSKENRQGLYKEYDFLLGDTFQIYSVRDGRLNEHVNLERYPVTMARSGIFKKWIRPILPELGNIYFCVHLGDRPCDETVEGMPNLCFCKKKSDERDLRLIPDTYYLGQKGYVKRREFRKLYTTNWDNKTEQAIFRGSYTGAKPLENNIRAQLCSLANPLVDAKITGVNNAWEEEEIEPLRGKHLTKMEMAQYKYQIDIDGNTNSWDGFFWKLMSGSLTFKLPSEWHQWYYSQIQAGTHYVEFVDLKDLVEKLLFYREHDDIAREIALNARNFTRKFRFKDQYEALLEALNG